jgi:hypothetical protein
MEAVGQMASEHLHSQSEAGRTNERTDKPKNYMPIRDFSKVFGLIALIFDRMIEHGVCLIILPRHFDSTIFVGVMIL